MRPAFAAVGAWSATTLSCVLGALGLALLVINTRLGAPAEPFWGAVAVLSSIYPLIGALIVSRHPRNVIGWLLVFEGLTAGPVFFAEEYAVAGSQGLVAMTPAVQLAAWIDAWVGDVGFGSLALIFLLFPTGGPPSPRWRPLVWAACGYHRPRPRACGASGPTGRARGGGQPARSEPRPSAQRAGDR